jgi:hypothetical protein
MTALPSPPDWLSSAFIGSPGLIATVLMLVLLAFREVMQAALPDRCGRRIRRWSTLTIVLLAEISCASMLLRFVRLT